MRVALGTLVLALLPLRAGAADLKGKVVAVSGSEVTITLELPLLPNPGDTVRISFEIPGAGEVALEGTWVITAATPDRIVAKAAAGNTSRPQAGQSAVVASANPRPRPTAEAPIATPAAPPAPSAAVPPSGPPAIPPGPSLALPSLPPSAPTYALRHAHQSFRRLSIADAKVMLVSGRVTYQETGPDAKPEHGLSFTCAEFKGTQVRGLNRSERNSIKHLGLAEPAKLTLRASTSLGQLFEERVAVDALVRALNTLCDKR